VLGCSLRYLHQWSNNNPTEVNFGTLPFQKQESPADARVTRDNAVIPRWPSAAILDFIEPQIAPFDPPNPETLT